MEREQAIKEMAYRMWEQAGRPAGRDLEFWLQAEALCGEPRQGGPERSAVAITPAARDPERATRMRGPSPSGRGRGGSSKA